MSARLAALSCAACLLAACAALPPPLGADSALIPDTEGPTCTSQAAGPAGLALAEQVQGLLSDAVQRQRLQVGQILSLSLQRAMDDCWKQVSRGTAAPSAGEPGVVTTLSIDRLRCVQQHRLRWLVPLLLAEAVGQSEIQWQVDLEATLLDARGRVVWTRSYHDESGPVVYGFPLTDVGALGREMQQRVHQAAWRLARQVVRDQREWSDARRLDAREL